MSGHEPAPEIIQVWCLLIDHQTRRFGYPFSIMVPPEGHVETLAVKIKQKEPDYLASVKPHHLGLWKLYKPRSSKDVIRTEFLTTVKFLHEPSEDEDNDETARLLDPTDLISSEGPWPTHRVHVLVKVPPDIHENEPSEPRESNSLWFK
jgi:hypothetical protein